MSLSSTAPLLPITSDVIVIGSGIAGLAVAFGLEQLGLRTAVLEAGNRPYETRWDISTNEVPAADYGVKQSYVDLHVQRAFGGGSNVWGGWCATLRDANFARPDLESYAGWPIRRNELEPYYRHALKLLEVKGDPDALIEDSHPIVAAPNAVVKSFGLSPPVSASGQWLSRLQNSECIAVQLGVTVDGFEVEGGHVTAVHGRSADGTQVIARARYYVLAGGSCLNALLLEKNRRALGLSESQNGALGRYLLEHPYIYGRGRIVLRPEFEEAIVNSPHWFAGFLSVAPSLASLRDLHSRDFHILLSEVPESLWTQQERVSIQNYQAVFGKHPKVYSTILGMEQEPKASNGIHLNENGPETAGSLQLEFGSEQVKLSRVAIGWLKRTAGYAWFDSEKPDDIVAVGHLMGTTRMAAPGQPGVVDADCMVLNCPNLFVAGSSVFPSAGFVNPTLTIAALASRLSQHIGEVFHAP